MKYLLVVLSAVSLSQGASAGCKAYCLATETMGKNRAVLVRSTVHAGSFFEMVMLCRQAHGNTLLKDYSLVKDSSSTAQFLTNVVGATDFNSCSNPAVDSQGNIL